MTSETATTVYRGTTPTITLRVDKDIVDWTKYVTFQAVDNNRVHKNLVTVNEERLESVLEDDKTLITFTLTQRETLALGDYADDGDVAEVQVRAIKNGTAVSTRRKKVDIGRILLNGVIHE